MFIGVPKEIKNHEYRVSMTPSSVREAVDHGHDVIVETRAGMGIGCSDESYRSAGAEIVESVEEVFSRGELIVKVKEPQASERRLLREGHILFTYLHLASDSDQTHDLLSSGATCIAYETVTSAHGGLPLLAPMSQVAGRMSIQAGAHCLEKESGGMGKLPGGVPGVPPARILILGGGMVGHHAARMAVGLGSDVVIAERNPVAMNRLEGYFGHSVKTVYSTRLALEEEVLRADIVIGGVLIPGAAAPKLVSRAMLKEMRSGSVIVDVAIDQGGCVETSHPTTHSDPTYIVDDVVHYCVANMPGAVPMTSTHALNNVTLGYILRIADRGWREALHEDKHFMQGLNVHKGHVTHAAVASDLSLDYMPPEEAIALV